MNLNSKFPCSGCGLCCQNISGIKELEDFDLGNGVCKYFDFISSSCSIYQERPLVCRVDEMYEKRFSNLFSKKEFYIENAKICNTLQEKYKIDISYRIKIKEI